MMRSFQCLNLDVDLKNNMLQLTDNTGTKVTSDSLLVANFVTVKSGAKVLEIGTGCGVIALMLAQKNRLSVLGIDIDAENIRSAEKNLCANSALLKGDVRLLVKSAGTCRHRNSENILTLWSAIPLLCAWGGESIAQSAASPGSTGSHAGSGRVFGTSRYVLRNKGSLFLVYPPEKLAKLFELAVHLV